MKNTIFRIVKEENLPEFLILNVLDAQKHFLVETRMKYAKKSKEEISKLKKSVQIVVEDDADLSNTLAFIHDTQPAQYYVAQGTISGKSGHVEKLKAILLKNLAHHEPEKLLLMVGATLEIAPKEQLKELREIMPLSRECSLISAFHYNYEAKGLSWYLMMMNPAKNAV